MRFEILILGLESLIEEWLSRFKLLEECQWQQRLKESITINPFPPKV